MRESGGHSEAIWQIAYTATHARRQDLLTALVGEIGWTVQSGPFAGMTLGANPDGALLPKLLGCYESELHAVISDIAAASPDLVVNIGCGEGYYAVGMARLVPKAFVHAFDSNPESQDLCRQAVVSNDVTSRVSVSGQCTPALLDAILPRGRTPVVICDCAGYEKELIDPRRVAALRSATLLIECHDFIDPTITQTLAGRLDATHDLIGIRESARDPNAIDLLQNWNSLDRWLAVCEYRPCVMHWLAARPKSAPA